MINLDKLEKLANGATPGEWYTGTGWEQMEPGKFICARDGGGVVLVDDEDEQALSDADHAYIAAANPSTILELIAEVRRLRARALPDVDTMANIIREVDGNNTLGAGALAEAILAKLEGM